MKLFRLKADYEFMAEDLDAAFAALAEHFMALGEVEHALIDGESFTPTLISPEGGEIVLEKVE